MAIINEMLEQQKLQSVNTNLLSPQTPANFLDQITGLLREINHIINNPLVAQKLIGKVAPNQVPVTTQPQPVTTFDEQSFIKYLMTPEGKKSIIGGLNKIKDMVGDVRISEMVAILEKGDFNDRVPK